MSDENTIHLGPCVTCGATHGSWELCPHPETVKAGRLRYAALLEEEADAADESPILNVIITSDEARNIAALLRAATPTGEAK